MMSKSQPIHRSDLHNESDLIRAIRHKKLRKLELEDLLEQRRKLLRLIAEFRKEISFDREVEIVQNHRTLAKMLGRNDVYEAMQEYINNFPLRMNQMDRQIAQMKNIIENFPAYVQRAHTIIHKISLKPLNLSVHKMTDELQNMKFPRLKISKNIFYEEDIANAIPRAEKAKRELDKIIRSRTKSCTFESTQIIDVRPEGEFQQFSSKKEMITRKSMELSKPSFEHVQTICKMFRPNLNPPQYNKKTPIKAILKQSHITKLCMPDCKKNQRVEEKIQKYIELRRNAKDEVEELRGYLEFNENIRSKNPEGLLEWMKKLKKNYEEFHRQLTTQIQNNRKTTMTKKILLDRRLNQLKRAIPTIDENLDQCNELST